MSTCLLLCPLSFTSHSLFSFITGHAYTDNASHFATFDDFKESSCPNPRFYLPLSLTFLSLPLLSLISLSLDFCITFFISPKMKSVKKPHRTKKQAVIFKRYGNISNEHTPFYKVILITCN